MSGLPPGRLRHAEHVMGTVVSFDVPAWAARDALSGAVRWLHWVDATFSPYRDDSDVSRFGRGSLALADCAPELAEVLAACADVAALSGGYFTVNPGGRFDPSGYVKGWAIERAAALLTDAGSARHTVNGGGDIQCVGDRGPGQPWRVGIAHPLRPGTLAIVVSGQDFAVATSGTAERGPHVINPHTGEPAVGLASITVAGPSLAAADAYATAAFAMGPAARDWAESLDGYEAFAITAAGAVWQTAGFGSYGAVFQHLQERRLASVVDEQAVVAQPQAGGEAVLLQTAVVHEVADRHAAPRRAGDGWREPGRAGRLAAVTSYTQFFSGTATVAGALVGLLFVALSVNPERLKSVAGSVEHQAMAGTAFTALIDALFVSLIGLQPGGGLEYGAVILGGLGLTSSTGLAVRLWRVRGREALSRRWPYLLGFIIVVYAAQVISGLLAGSAASQADLSVTFVYIMFATGISRSWELLGLRGGGPLDLLVQRLEAHPPPPAASPDSGPGAS